MPHCAGLFVFICNERACRGPFLVKRDDYFDSTSGMPGTPPEPRAFSIMVPQSVSRLSSRYGFSHHRRAERFVADPVCPGSQWVSEKTRALRGAPPRAASQSPVFCLARRSRSPSISRSGGCVQLSRIRRMPPAALNPAEGAGCHLLTGRIPSTARDEVVRGDTANGLLWSLRYHKSGRFRDLSDPVHSLHQSCRTGGILAALRVAAF